MKKIYLLFSLVLTSCAHYNADPAYIAKVQHNYAVSQKCAPWVSPFPLDQQADMQLRCERNPEAFIKSAPSLYRLNVIPVSDKKVIDFCHEIVLNNLKAPATAKFSSDRVGKRIGNETAVFGVVDSENSFSALLRLHYACNVRWENHHLAGDVNFLD